MTYRENEMMQGEIEAYTATPEDCERCRTALYADGTLCSFHATEDRRKREEFTKALLEIHGTGRCQGGSFYDIGYMRPHSDECKALLRMEDVRAISQRRR